MPPWLKRLLEYKDYWPEAALVLIFTITYYVTLLPGLHEFGDVTKAQFLGRLLGTTHPTGYPLYIIASGAFSWIPVGTLAQRVNAFSAVCAIVALVFVCRIQRRLGVRACAAFAVCAALGWSRTFWSQSVIAEVYALNAALVAGTLYCLLRWHESKSERWFIGACGVYAISFGNHLTMVTLLPAFTFATFAGDFRVLRRPHVSIAVAFVILLGMSLYYYPIWSTEHHSLYVEYVVRNFGELVDYVTGERYRAKMFAFSPEELLFERLPRFWGQLVSELGLFGLLFPAGAVVCKDRWAAGVLSLAFLAELVWVTGYDIPDIEVYIIPVALLAAILAGIALEAIAGSGRVRGLVVAGVCFVAVAALPYYNRRSVRHDKSVRFDEEIGSTLAALGHDAVVVGRVNYGERMGLVYHLIALGKSAERHVYLAYEARPEQVARYLRGRGKLKDSHTDQPVPRGLRVYITRRAEKEGWRSRDEFNLGDRVGGVRELTLK